MELLNKKAPDFKLMSTSGKEVSLKDLKGKNVVLYFYPKDDTPGCTQEGIDFSKNLKTFENLNTVVFGISRDSCEKHCKFQEKFKFKHHLLSDNESKTCEDYGVIKEKNMFGKKSIGIERSTFLIDEKGKIIYVWRKVKVEDHVKEVLNAIENLT